MEKVNAKKTEKTVMYIGGPVPKINKVCQFIEDGGNVEYIPIGWSYIMGIQTEISVLIDSKTGREFFTGYTIEKYIRKVERVNKIIVYPYSDYVIEFD